MEGPFTPRQIARSLGIGESTVKRWCDKNLIPTQWTAGGHRRICREDLCKFLRENDYSVQRPELLGLPSNVGSGPWTLERAHRQFTAALVAGDEELCSRIVCDLYFGKHPVGSIFDKLMVPTFEEIGTQWECGELEVFQERRACRIVLRIMESLRRFIKPSQANSPLAIGMNPEGDFYEIVGTMVEIVLKDLGWQANFLGNNLPLDSLRAAIERHRPRLVWLSCSHLTDEWRFIEQWNALFDRFGSEISFVVGGRALHGEMRKNLRFTVHCDTVSQLEQAARITAFAS